MSSLRPALCALALAPLLLSGCGLVPPPVSTANRPDITAAPPTPVAVEAAKAGAKKNKHRRAHHGWVALHDSSGIRFELPTRREGVPGPLGRTYVDTSTPMSYEVDVLEFSSPGEASRQAASFDLANLAVLAAAGFSHPKVSSSGSGSTRDVTVSFTGEGIQADQLRYNLIRMHTAGRTLVLVQTYAVGRDGQALRDRVQKAHHRLLAGVHYA